MASIERTLSEVVRYAGQMDSSQWIGVMVGAVVLGFFILSGYSSKLG